LSEEGFQGAQKDLRGGCTDIRSKCKSETGCSKGTEEGGPQGWFAEVAV